MTSKVLILAAARPEDAPSIHAAYTAWNDPNVLPRPETDIREAAERGLFFVLKAGDEIVGATAVYDLTDAHVESGSTFVDPRYRGYRIQKLFFELRLATIVAFEGPDISFTTAIDPGNAHSLATTVANGFVPMQELLDAQIAPCKDCPKQAKALAADRKCCCSFYELPMEAAQSTISSLLGRIQPTPVTLTHRQKPPIEVVLQCRAVTDKDTVEALRDFVAGRMW